MNFSGIFTAVLFSLCLTKVGATFYIECSCMAETDTGISGVTGREKIPQSRGTLLYKCEHEETANGDPVTECKLLAWFWQKRNAYSIANFYSITNKAVFEPGRLLIFDGEKLTKPPNVLTVGYKRRDIDSPNFQTPDHSCEKVEKEVNALTPDFVTKDDRVVKNIIFYLCANDISIFFTDERARDDVMPTFASTLNKIMTVYDSYILPYSASKRELLEKCKRAMILMIPKMIDPCIVYDFAKTKDDRSWVSIHCQLFCQFLSTAGEVFDRVFDCKCTYLKAGKCKNNVCICEQYLPLWKYVHRPHISMLQCNNAVRLQLDSLKRG